MMIPDCVSCLEAGIRTPATTTSIHPDWGGYALCEACAEEYDNRPLDERTDEDDDATQPA